MTGDDASQPIKNRKGKSNDNNNEAKKSKYFQKNRKNEQGKEELKGSSATTETKCSDPEIESDASADKPNSERCSKLTRHTSQ